jgi:adenylate cyclase
VSEPTGTEEVGVWAVLRRRKVVQWGVAYAAGSWGLLQGLGYVTATFHWPNSLQPIATLALLIGLPIVLVIAWYHGDRGQQRITGAELAIITLLFLVGGGLFWRYDRAGGPGTEDPSAAIAAAGATQAPANAPSRRSIAVLPFANMSGDPSSDYFSDGISEEILNVLARTSDLQVAARTSSFAFKGKSADIPQIARDLKVRMVLEGSVRKQADRVRITAQLIDAETGFHLWSQTYDRELKDIFAIQDEIAAAIGNELEVTMAGSAGAGAAAKGSSNAGAHDLYLRGLALWQERSGESLWAARQALEGAVAADPEFARAYAGLALVYAVIPDYTTRISYSDASTNAVDAAEMALALDPTQPEPYAVLATIASTELRREASVALYQRSIALGPSFATAYQWLGTQLMAGGDPEAGLVYSQRAVALDPRSRVASNNLSYVLLALGRNAEARAECDRVLAFAPDYYDGQEFAGVVALVQGDYEPARGYLRRAAELHGSVEAAKFADTVVDALQGHGDRRAVARRLAASDYRRAVTPGSDSVFAANTMALLIVMLGEPALALDYLERTTNEVGFVNDWALVYPALDPIRCDPRFVALIKRAKTMDPRAPKVCPATT